MNGERTINGPVFTGRQAVADHTTALTSYLPVPGFGVLPVNAFVIHAREPVLVDTGLNALESDFMQALRQTINPAELRWIWITHADADHIGNLHAVLNAAPRAIVVTNFLGMGKLAMQRVPAERIFLLNPGQYFDVGDRRLKAITPPSYDAPETMAVFDENSRSLFSSDCFGALIDSPFETANDVPPEVLRQGCIAWAGVDAPWLKQIPPGKLLAALDGLRSLKVRTVLGSHLPPAHGMTNQLLRYLAEAREAPAFVGPDQVELEKILAA